MKEHRYCVYIMTNWNNKVLYIGITNNLERRVYEHKNKLLDGFTKKYNLNKLVYYEEFNDVNLAILREKEIKKWRREKKDKLINTVNLKWEDLGECFQDLSHSFEMTGKKAITMSDENITGGDEHFAVYRKMLIA